MVCGCYLIYRHQGTKEEKKKLIMECALTFLVIFFFFFLQGPELGKFSDICTEMSCKVPGASRSYRVYKAATGTSCGDKKVI